jgi:hypothetical protein
MNRRRIVQRVHTVSGEHADSALMIRDDGALVVGVPGEYVSTIVPRELATSLRSLALKDDLTTGDVYNLSFPYFTSETVKTAQAVIFKVFPRLNDRILGPDKISRRHLIEVKDIQYRRWMPPPTDEHDFEEKQSGDVTVQPLLEGKAFIPARSRANEQWTLDERITATHNPQRSLPFKYQQHAVEFVDLVAGGNRNSYPRKTIREIYDNSSKPSQRRDIETASRTISSYSLDRVEIKSFQKVESYPKPAPPRNISTLPTEQFLRYSGYTQNAMDVLKTTEFYAFGVHPDELAIGIQEQSIRAKDATETDYSRFDGYHSEALYELELLFLKRIHHVSCHDDIVQVQAAVRKAGCKTTTGLRYRLGGSRASGAACTAFGNSFDNTFVMYCTYREMGFSKDEAYKRLGKYGGDDGISFDIDVKVLRKVCADLGLKIKVFSKPISDTFGFLGRYYYNLPDNGRNSADPLRQIAKLHITSVKLPHRVNSLDLQPELQLCRAVFGKASGIKATDPHTPILAPWAQAMLGVLSVPLVAYVETPEYFLQTNLGDLPLKYHFGKYTPCQELQLLEDRYKSYDFKTWGVLTSAVNETDREKVLAEISKQLNQMAGYTHRFDDIMRGVANNVGVLVNSWREAKSLDDIWPGERPEHPSAGETSVEVWVNYYTWNLSRLLFAQHEATIITLPNLALRYSSWWLPSLQSLAVAEPIPEQVVVGELKSQHPGRTLPDSKRGPIVNTLFGVATAQPYLRLQATAFDKYRSHSAESALTESSSSGESQQQRIARAVAKRTKARKAMGARQAAKRAPQPP